MEIREEYMRRALHLASKGAGRVSPNPMVGAMIVRGDKIIGEGWHRRCGEAHAEVNAVASVADKELLKDSTMYVTLEPCSHYGKTPPCAELIIRCGIPRVVVGVLDPFEKVSGRGVKMLRDAGVEVEVGLLEDECRKINRRFMTAHSQGRPFIMLKWAQSADGFMSRVEGTPVALSNPLSRMMMHRERSLYDAIMVGTTTVITDNPRLTVRDWCGDSPRCVTFNQHGRLPVESHIASGERSIILTECLPLEEQMRRLYREHGVTSLMVEGGACLLKSFIDAGLYDDVRVETSTVVLGDGVKAPSLDCEKVLSQTIRGNEIHLKSS